MKIYTKDSLVKDLKKIVDLGWVKSARPGNSGGVGNTLEDLLGIEENNLPIPNAAEWELKTQRLNTTSLVTLFHIEPSPRAIKFIPQVLLPNYGWKHQKAGQEYPKTEMSFRQTISGKQFSDRGFKVVIDEDVEKILISFNADMVAKKHSVWLDGVDSNIGLLELSPQPYWGFDDLKYKAGTKLTNCFFVQADVKKECGVEFYQYKQVTMLQKFSFAGFLGELVKGNILVDFDARTGHNHGTKFRMRQNCLPALYEFVTKII